MKENEIHWAHSIVDLSSSFLVHLVVDTNIYGSTSHRNLALLNFEFRRRLPHVVSEARYID